MKVGPPPHPPRGACFFCWWAVWVLLYIDVGERWYSYPEKSEKFAQKQGIHGMNIQKIR